MRKRKKTKQVTVKDIKIGGDAPVSVQSMTNLPIEDVNGTIDQIIRLENEGADIVRVALRNEDSVEHLKKVIKNVHVPVVADIHFNYRIALKAIDAGINKIRINPGNIGHQSRVKEVVKAALASSIPIRIGVNGGSINRKKYSEVTPENLVESALEHVRILEDNNFDDIVVSIKTSDIFHTMEANRLFSRERDYPIHVGLTEAGYGMASIVQSSFAIGSLLSEGIGDTIRVSITGDPVDEIAVGKKILETVGERPVLVKIISCPTCGRTSRSIDILQIAKDADRECHNRFSKILKEKNRSLSVAIMGCEVNGPGEAMEADVGLAGGYDGYMLLFAKGEKLKKVKVEDAIDSLLIEVEKIL